MAKLHAVITNDKGKQRSISADEKIIIELKYKNSRVRHLKFQVEEGTGGDNWEVIEVE